MRLISLICLFMIVVQSALPCRDKAMGTVAVQPTTISNYKSVSHDDVHQDGCTPFCQCSCCATPSLQHPPITHNVFVPEMVSGYVGYILPDVFQFPLDIWQPPQLRA